jgi:PAS domain S-box-containing protein
MCPLETSGNGSASALLAAILNSSDDAIVGKNPKGIITSWNRAAERIYGYTSLEAVNQHINLIVPEERRAEADEVLARVVGGEPVGYFETLRRAKDGKLLNISLMVSPIQEAPDQVVGAVELGRDLTDRKRLKRYQQEQLLLLKKEVAVRKKVQAELAEALTARDDFIAVAAHELRNPLNVFVLTLQLLHRVSRDIAGSAEVRKLIERSQVQIGRVNTLMARLLDVTRIQGGSFELYKQTFDLSQLIREVVVRIAGEPASASISLVLQPSIEGTWDRLRIDQALTNLISNAVKYGLQKPISVTASTSDGGDAVIRVRDQGVGISSRDLKRIFDRFQRAKPRLGNEGLGLGLWVAKQVVKAHAGTIFAQSEPGVGSTFTMRLPLQ